MYIKDGSSKDYAGDQRMHGIPLFKNLYAFGWIGDKIEYSEWKDKKLKKRNY